MKKIFALALAIVMMMAIALPVFADYTETEATGAESEHFSGTVPAEEKYENFDDMLLKYGVKQEYIVTIPADVTFDTLDVNEEYYVAQRNVKAEGIVISGSEVFTIAVVSANTWQLVDKAGKSDDVDYAAKLADDPMTTAADDEITYDSSKSGTQYVLIIDPAEGNNGWENKAEDDVNIDFSTRGTAQEGMFLDTLTFTVEIFETEDDPRNA